MGRADSDNAGGSGNTGGGGGSSGGGSSSSDGRGNNTPGRNARGSNTNSSVGPGNNTPGPMTGNNRRGDRISNDTGGRGSNTPGSNPRGSNRNPATGAGNNTPGPRTSANRRGDRVSEDGRANPGGMNGVSAIAGGTESEDDGMLSGVVDSFKSALDSMFGDDDATTAESIRSLRDLDKQITQSQLSKSILGDEDASLENAINAETEAGGFSRIASAALSVFGGIPGFAVGQVGKSLSKAKKASDTISDLNNTGMNLDDSFSSSAATQARGLGVNNVVGGLVSNTLGPLGAKIGKYGPAVTGIMSSEVAKKAGDVAMRDMPSTASSTNPSGLNQSVTGGRGQNTPSGAPSNPAGIASTTPAQTTGKISGFAGGYDYGIDSSRGFNAYGSYATRFFG